MNSLRRIHLLIKLRRFNPNICFPSMLTISSSVSRVTLKMSPCSVWARKKNIDLVLWVAEQTKIMPRSGSSKSFWRTGQFRREKEKSREKQNENRCVYRDQCNQTQMDCDELNHDSFHINREELPFTEIVKLAHNITQLQRSKPS